jgi:hypothetical protein
MDSLAITVKSIAENFALYIPIIIAIIGLIKYVKGAIEKQKLLLEELRKLQELVTLALSDKYIDSEEVRKILIALKECQEMGMDTLEAYKDAYDKLIDLISKFKVKRLKAEKLEAKKVKMKGGSYD